MKKVLRAKIQKIQFFFFLNILLGGTAYANELGNINFEKFNFSKNLLEGVEMSNILSGELGTFQTKTNELFRPQYFTRKDWGADESLRVWSENRGITKTFRIAPEESKWLEKKDWPQISSRNNEKGEILTWPIEENKFVKKIIIHHTGEYINDTHQMRRDPKSHMRSIYAYHTLSKKWGDIGYNFVIDKKGNIYEGRYGGPKTVGAHTAFYNTGTIGIALMGNFEIEEPTDAQLKVLAILAGYLSDQYKINPNGKQSFLEIESNNITGHRFVTREGHGTACPGKNMIKRLSEIRKNIQIVIEAIKEKRDDIPKGLDFLSKSSKLSKIQRHLPRFERQEKKPLLQLKGMIKNRPIIQREEEKVLSITIKNNTKRTWKAGAWMEATNLPPGITATKFRTQQDILPEQSGTFEGKIYIQKTPNGFYEIKLDPVFAAEFYFNQKERPIFSLPIQISGDKNIQTINPNRIQPAKNNIETQKIDIKKLIPIKNSVKVKLAFFKESYANVRSNSKITLYNNKGDRVAIIPENETIRIFKTPQKTIKISGNFPESEFPFIHLKTNTFFEITNYNRGINKNIAYNKFRNQLSFYATNNDEFLIVNELPIEDYLYGLGEEPSTEPNAKKHAIHILARSYAYVYSGERRKFKTNLYDLEDDPRSSQLYLGFDWEFLRPEQTKLVKETKGVMITHKGIPVIGPYFTQSNGKTLDIWKKQYPWAKAQEIPYDKGLEQRGHGVGLSGNAARALAKEGKSYQEILNYFFQDIKIQKIY